MESSGGQRLEEGQGEAQHPDQKPPAQAYQRSDGCHRKAPGRRPYCNCLDGQSRFLQNKLRSERRLLQVSLPDRKCEVHRLKLSEEEQAVYDVVFAQSRWQTIESVMFLQRLVTFFPASDLNTMRKLGTFCSFLPDRLCRTT